MSEAPAPPSPSLSGDVEFSSSPPAERYIPQISTADFDCPVCLELLCDPVTSPACGHSFCRECIARSLTHKPICPSCRSPCSFDPLTAPTALLLSSLISQYFPVESSQRRSNQTFFKQMPKPRYGLFLSSVTNFPGQQLRLHIFEPKYRVLINRALANSRKFLCVCVSQKGKIQSERFAQLNMNNEDNTPPNAGFLLHGAMNGAEAPTGPAVQTAEEKENFLSSPGLVVGCLVSITHCRTHFDGRSFVEAIGIERVKISRIVEEENSFGLLTGEIEKFDDQEENQQNEENLERKNQEEQKREENIQAEATMRHRGEEKQPEPPENSSNSVSAIATALRASLDAYSKSSGSSLERMQLIHGPIPETPSEFSFWLCRALPGSTELKESALQSTSLVDRLRICEELIDQATQDAAKSSQSQSILIFIILLLALASIFNK